MSHTIAIIDDHVLIAKALTGIIENFKNFTVLYEAENGSTLIENCKNKKNIPDIVLLDINMPLMNGFETATWLKQNHPDVLIMALSMQDDEASVIGMIRAGATGYLLKNAHPVELEKALNALIKNGCYYPDWASNKVLNNLAKNEKTENQVTLNEREIEFLKYACTELTYKEIAEKMYCSPRTVEGYRDNLFERLGFKTRVGLVTYAMKTGIWKP